MQAIPGAAARGLSSRITTPLGATSSCALLWSCTSNVYWLAALIEYLRSAATSATKASRAGITRSSPCSRPTRLRRRETMMELLQSMICHVSEKVLGTLVIEQKDEEGNVTKTIDLTPTGGAQSIRISSEKRPETIGSSSRPNNAALALRRN